MPRHGVALHFSFRGTGAGACTNQGGVSRRALAKYAPRHYLEYFIRGVVRDQLYDLSTDTWDEFLETDGSPKPAFYAVKSLIALIQDAARRSTRASSTIS